MKKRFTLVLVALLGFVLNVSGVTSTTLDLAGGWGYYPTGQVTISFSKEWQHAQLFSDYTFKISDVKKIYIKYTSPFQLSLQTISNNENHAYFEQKNLAAGTNQEVTWELDNSDEKYSTDILRLDLINSISEEQYDQDQCSAIIYEVKLLDGSDNVVNDIERYSNKWGTTITPATTDLVFPRWANMGNGQWATTYNTGETHRYIVEFKEAVVQGFQLYAKNGETNVAYAYVPSGANKVVLDVAAAYTDVILAFDYENNPQTVVDIESVKRIIYGSGELTSTTLYNTSIILPYTENEQSIGYKALSYDAQPTGLKNAKIGDVIRLTYSTSNQWDNNLSMYDHVGWENFDSNSKTYSWLTTGTTCTFNYEIVSAKALQDIQEVGIVLVGNNVTITNVELLTSSESKDMAPVHITSAGKASFCSPKVLDFSDSRVKAYIATAATNGVVTLERIYKTPANAGLLLVGEEGDYEIPVAASGDAVETNLLIGNPNRWEIKVYESMTGEYRYIFASGESGVGFYKVTAEGLSNTETAEGTYNGKKYHTLAAHKAYLQTTGDVSGSAPMLRFEFEDENNATSVESFKEQDSSCKFFENGRLFIRKNGVTYTITGMVVK